MMNTSDVLIIGTPHHNTYGLLRCFGIVGIKADLIIYDCEESYLGHSIYINRLWYCTDARGALAKVQTLVVEEGKHYVVISASDEIASLMDLNFNVFKDHCFFFNAGEAGLLNHFMDKKIQIEVAEKAGFVVPATRSICNEGTLHSDFYPCIIKPLASIEGGKRISICHSQKELDACNEKFYDVKRVLVQQYISGDEEIVILGLSVGKEVIIPGYITKIREINGGTTFSRTVPVSKLDSSIVNNAKQLIESIHYEGLFGIECIRAQGKYYFIEINLRNDATSFSLATAGVNLPFLYYCLCIGKPVKNVDKVRELYSMVEIPDFRNVLHKRVGLRIWLKQRRLSECRYFYSKEDHQLYRLARKEFISHLWGRLFSIKPLI